jgi:hypothetical protein
MSIRRILVPALSIIVLACGSLAAHAQTGPLLSKKSGGTMPGPNAPQGIVQSLTADRVISMLQAKGAETTVSNQDIKGVKFHIVRAKMQADDFGYDFDVVFVTFANGTRVWYFSTPLNTNGMSLSAEKLQGLLKRNHTMAANFSFMIDPQTGTVMLQSSRIVITVRDQEFQNELGTYMKNIKETYQWWSNAE